MVLKKIKKKEEEIVEEVKDIAEEVKDEIEFIEDHEEISEVKEEPLEEEEEMPAEEPIEEKEVSKEDVETKLDKILVKPPSKDSSADIKTAKNFLKNSRVISLSINTIDADERVITAECVDFNNPVKISYDEFSNFDAKYLKPHQLLLDRPVKALIKEVDDKTGDVWASVKDYMATQGDHYAKTNKAEILYFVPWGAVVKIVDDNLFGVIRDESFVPGKYIKVMDVFDKGDTVDVVTDGDLTSDNLSFKIANPDKIKIERKYTDEELSPGKTLIGKVKSIQPVGTFVGLDIGIDGLCSIPEYLTDDVYVNRKVVYKITRSELVDGSLRIKGKILSVL